MHAAAAAAWATWSAPAGRPPRSARHHVVGTARGSTDRPWLAPLDRRSVEVLQATAGNRAVAGLLSAQRAPASPAAPARRVTILVQRELAPDDADRVARKLHDAMAGWGTDEEAIFAALSGRTGPEMAAIRQAYRRLYRVDLDAELRDELTADELVHLSQMAPVTAIEAGMPGEEIAAANRARVTADQLRGAMEGLGTDEDAIFAALSGRSASEILEIRRQYRSLTGRELEADLNDELSGSDLRRALNLLDLAPEEERVGFEECGPVIREELRGYIPKAKEQVRKAIRALEPGWGGMDAAVRSSFRRYFDPANSGDIDADFVVAVRENFQAIGEYMETSLTFDCDLGSGSICGDGYKWCGTGVGNGRLYWTCFGNIHVCANPGWMVASDERKWSDIIHESTHNALQTTDRAYCGDPQDFGRLTPYGRGIGSALMGVPIVGFVAKLAGGGGDTLHNPDSYSHFAQRR